MIEVKEIKSEKELIDFVEFPFKLYKGNKYWVPSIKKDELKRFEKFVKNTFHNLRIKL